MILDSMQSRLPANSDTMDNDQGARLFRSAPFIYVVVLILCFVGTFIVKLRTRGIFACSAEGYSSESFVAYCQAAEYGDYDHGAFWFDLEPTAHEKAADADVLFLGNSRMQFAFSNDSTAEWFSSLGRRYYLLGFSHTENITFTGPLIARLRPRARAYVINVDHFFDDIPTQPGAAILGSDDARSRYLEKRAWQPFHRSICTSLPAICGSHFAYYRSSESGDWEIKGSEAFQAASVSDEPPANQDRWEQYAHFGEGFISGLSVDRKCIILTIVPSQETPRAEAMAIASALGMDVVSPQVSDLSTFDGSHLDPASSKRWAQAFFDAAGPLIRECLAESTGPEN